MSSRPATPAAAAAVQIPDHTLLRVIGRGSYGEVWLARNVMGTHRAVKIVRRAAFDSDRPYLREFEGIRRCEPVSRAHDGLIDLLHMGRHDEAGFFYYVMELADAADGAFDVEQYRPATLADRISHGPRMEAGECLRVAESLAGALAFLHEQGLIHRDVKPSNVMFVGGVPKLGDIGLVAEAGSSRSFVGTEGFVPQEGPGTERADIFALGKVLYETLTGMDRSKFPLLPQDWRKAYDFEQRVELNEIVLRACEGHSERRYFSAREVLADVALVASGKSVRKMRGMETRLRVLRWLGGGAVSVAVVALGISWLWQRQAAEERKFRERAVQAESAEREARFEALLNQVHAARHDPSPGAVTRALKVASEAAGLRATPELRDDASFLLSRPDFVERADLKIPWSATMENFVVDAESGVSVEVAGGRPADAPGPLLVTLHFAGAPEKRRCLTIEHAPPSLTRLQLSRGAQRLLAAGPYGTWIAVDLETGGVLGTIPQNPHLATTPVFCGEKGEAVIRRASDGGLAIYKLPGGARESTPRLADWPVRDQRRQEQRLWPSPDGRFVLLIDTELVLPSLPGLLLSILTPEVPAPRGAASLVEVATGRIVWKVSGPDEQVAAWSDDGTRIAVRAGDRILSLDAATGRTAATAPQRIHNRGTQIIFLDSRDTLAFSTWSTTGMCDLSRDIMLGRPAVLERWSYSRRRGHFAAGSGTAEWRPSPVLRTIAPPQFINRAVYFSFSPKDEWLIAGYASSFAMWRTDRFSSDPDVTLPVNGAGNVLFSPDGKTAQFLTDAGLHETAWGDGPPASLPEPLPYGPDASGESPFATASRDGKTIAFGGYRYVIVRQEGAEPRVIPTRHNFNTVGLSPDGRWLAVGAFHENDVRVFDLTRSDDEPVHVEASGQGSYPAFSPDGKWLACSGSNGNRILHAGTWTLEHRRPRSSNSLLGYISFSSDSRLMSMMETPSRCAIVEPGKTWRTLFHLDSPLDEIFERSTLSASGRYFAAVGTRKEIYIWDLQALAAELQKLGLGEGLAPVTD